MIVSATVVDTVARVCLVSMFPPSAVDKIVRWRACMAQTRSARIPGPPIVAVGMVVAAIAVEFVTPIMIVGHAWDRPAALVLAAFCAVTAVMYHPFWAFPGLFGPDDASPAREHFWQFLKNFCIVGGLLSVALAGNGPSLGLLGPA
ncbi:DoxX family protein [Glacieibacterium megasporae]|uniref:DoxX family protein n=1 Tax=Glacieibacterium megasporae TaxID=2835787 RepID=UPI001C1DDBD7|nr:DoxX family protein [Polymorphobacter megasporae]UAJ09046.1 DoxX family protein [Polymorphobacter megasporae]